MAEENDAEEMSAGIKVAILMISLGQETTAEVMKYLSDIEIERIAQNIAELDVVTTEQDDMVLEEFEQMLIAGQYVSQGGMEFARGLWRRQWGRAKPRRSSTACHRRRRADSTCCGTSIPTRSFLL